MAIIPYYLLIIFSLALLGSALGGLLGLDPLKETQNWMGWGAVFAIITSLAVQPIITIFQARLIYPLKKSFGLVAFICAFLHFILYQLDQGFSFDLMSEDFWVRHHIRYGMISLFILSLLAITSHRKAQKIMKQNWKRLHRLTYIASVFIGLHVLTSTKSIDFKNLWPLGVIFFLLMLRLKKVSSNFRRLFGSFPGKKVS